MRHRQGGIGFGPPGPLPEGVKALLVANGAIFLLTWLFPGLVGGLVAQLGLTPREALLGGKLWQPFTYMFLHGGLLHIVFNMFLVWMFGSALEAHWGRRDFLTYYVVCGLGGAVATVLIAFLPFGLVDPEVMTIGASAAALGLLVAYGMMYPDAVVLLWFILPIKMKYLVWLLAAADLIIGTTTTGDGLAHFAHLGGMLTGYLYLKQDWRLSAWRRKAKGEVARRRMAQRARQLEQRLEDQKAQQERVDAILDKISEQGIDSLSPEERRILEEARRR